MLNIKRRALVMWLVITVLTVIPHLMGIASNSWFMWLMMTIFINPLVCWGITHDTIYDFYGELKDFLKEKFNA